MISGYYVHIIALLMIFISCNSSSTHNENNLDKKSDSVPLQASDTIDQHLIKLYDTIISQGPIRSVIFYMDDRDLHLLCRINDESIQTLGRYTSIGEQPPSIEAHYLGDSIGLGYLLTTSLIAMDTSFNIISLLRIDAKGKCDEVLVGVSPIGKCSIEEVNDDFEYYSTNFEMNSNYSSFVIEEHFPKTTKKKEYSTKRVYIWNDQKNQYMLSGE